MLSRTHSALKYLAWGILLGLLFAPRGGAETRHQLRSWVSSTAREVTSGLAGR